MYTVCPHCNAVFRVSAVLLGKAGGQARCGSCRQSYDVIEYLYEDLDAVRNAIDEAVAESMAAEPQPATPPDGEPAHFMPAATDAAPVAGDAAPPAESDDVDDAPSLRGQPPLTAWHQHGLGARDVLGVFLMLLLLGMLGLQWTWFNRARLAADPAWRAGLEPICELVPCNLPLRTDLAQLALVARDVRKHPSVAAALLINASFENRAGFAQPYPYLEVSFSDRNGTPLAARRFAPAEYLGPDAVIGQGLPAQGVARATLEILDPGAAAVSYQFEFL